MNIETTTFKNAVGVKLTSGDGEEYPGCKLVISGGHKYITINLPQLISPKREKVYFKSWDHATITQLGRNWYYNYTEREYGFSVFENHVSIMYGMRTHDSSTEQRWGFFIPWLERRCVVHTAHFFDGLVINKLLCNWRDGSYEETQKQIETARKIRYQFKDFDGEVIEADCYVENWEWRQGTGWFKWVSVFCKPIVRQSINLEFSSEVGRRKGSWKGGALGHGCTMNEGENIRDTFIRYCSENELTFIGVVPWKKKVKKLRTEDQCCGSVPEACDTRKSK